MSLRTVFDIIAKDSATPTIGRVSKEMKGLGASAKAANQAMVGGTTGGVGKSTKVKPFSGVFGADAGGPIAKMLAGGALIGLGNNMTSFAMAAAKGSGAMETTIATMRAYGSSTEDVGKAQRAVMDAGFNVDKSAAAMSQLAREGFAANDAVKMLTPTMQMAKIAQLEAGESAAFLADTMDQFGRKADRGQDTVDKIAWAMKTFGTQGAEVQTMLKGAASGATLAGASFENVLLTTNMMKRVLPDAAKAGMAAGQAFMQLADERVQKELKRQGIAVYDSNKNFRSLTDILGDVITQTAGMTEAQRASALASIFSKRSAGGLSVIVKQLSDGIPDATGKMLVGADAARYLASGMDAATGSAAAMRGALTNTVAGAEEKMESATTRLKESMAEVTRGTYIKVVRAFAGGINAAADAVSTLPPIARQVVVGFTGVAGVFVKVLGASILLGGAMRMLGISFTGMLLTLGKVLLIGMPLLGLVGSLALGMYALKRASDRNVNGMGGTFSGFWEKIKLGFRGTLDLISGGGLSEAVQGELKLDKNNGVMKFLTWMAEAIGKAKAFFGGMVTGFENGLSRLDGPMGRFRDTLFNLLGMDTDGQTVKWEEFGKRVGDVLVTVAGTGIDMITNGLSKINELLGGLTVEDFEASMERIGGAISTALDVLVRFIDDLDWMVTTVTNISHVFDDVEGASQSQMLDWATIAGGAEGKRMLRQEFSNIDRKGRMGLIEGGPEAITQAKEQAYSKYEYMMGQDESDAISDVWAEGVKETTKELARLNANLEKAKTGADKQVVLKVGEERFAELVRGVDTKQKEAGYEEEGGTLLSVLAESLF